MIAGDAAAAAARALVGTRFRLHGRSREDGLDCVGMVECALRAAGWIGRAPAGYAVRTGGVDHVAARLASAGLTRVSDCRPGDILVLTTGPGQLHLAMTTDAGFVHADAGLRRVVERPGDPPWPVAGRWRWEG